MVAIHGSPPSRMNRDADDVAASTIQFAEAFAYPKTEARAKKAEQLVRKSRAVRAKKKQTWRPSVLLPSGEHYFAFVRHGLEAGIAALEVLQRRSRMFSLAVRREEIDRRRECPWPELIRESCQA